MATMIYKRIEHMGKTGIDTAKFEFICFADDFNTSKAPSTLLDRHDPPKLSPVL
jgi:hypothetical protein